MHYNVVGKQDDLTYNVCYLSFVNELESVEVIVQNSVKANIERLIYFPFLFMKVNH